MSSNISYNLISLLSNNFIMLNTFFFGYLSLKWRRLFRTLIMIPLVCWFGACIVEGGKPSEWILSIAPLPIVGLISWVVKPFVVKDKS